MSNFDLTKSIDILQRTPDVLGALLKGLDEFWTSTNEGPDTWSPYDVVGHLIHGEKSDWMLRLKMILNESDSQFPPFDRFAQFEDSKGKTLSELLVEFRDLRIKNLKELKSLNLMPRDLDKVGVHPSFGKVTARQLLATWVIHDLNHLNQISRVMSKRYVDEVGPWSQFLSILR